MKNAAKFWKTKKLKDLTNKEWEALCDGCAKCCVHKLEDEDTGRIYYTDVACRLLDLETCKCINYFERKQLVPDCICLTQDNILIFRWLPSTCAYRLIAEGKDLPEWHPLITGNSELMHNAGISVRGKLISEDRVSDFQKHIVNPVREPRL